MKDVSFSLSKYSIITKCITVVDGLFKSISAFISTDRLFKNNPSVTKYNTVYQLEENIVNF